MCSTWRPCGYSNTSYHARESTSLPRDPLRLSKTHSCCVHMHVRHSTQTLLTGQSHIFHLHIVVLSSWADICFGVSLFIPYQKWTCGGIWRKLHHNKCLLFSRKQWWVRHQCLIFSMSEIDSHRPVMGECLLMGASLFDKNKNTPDEWSPLLNDRVLLAFIAVTHQRFYCA